MGKSSRMEIAHRLAQRRTSADEVNACTCYNFTLYGRCRSLPTVASKGPMGDVYVKQGTSYS